jgi:hypothetical protein
MVEATLITSMSRSLIWAISWASTPVSSSSLRSDNMPSVTATVAFLGFRPVAKALGVCEGTMATLGMGRPAMDEMDLTMRWRRGASASVTIRAL